MKLEQSFDVQAPIEQVWRALIDVERVAPCLPGAQVTGRNQDGSYDGSFTVKIGPTTAAYSGRLEMQSIDEEARVATMFANGTDKRGQGGARATIVSRLESVDGGTRVQVETDYSITGRLARFGRGGMIEDISERLLREFAARLQASLESAGPGAAAGDEATTQEFEKAAVTAGSGDGDEWQTVATSAVAPPRGIDPSGAGAAPAPPGGPALSSPSPGAAPPPPARRPPAPPAEPLDAGALLGGVLLERVRRKPVPLAAGIGLLLALLVLRRRRA